MINTTYIIVHPEKCPKTHPFVYAGGRYCCQYGFEHILQAYGENCDGGPISINSVCCKQFAYIRCPTGVCKNRGKYKG